MSVGIYFMSQKLFASNIETWHRHFPRLYTYLRLRGTQFDVSIKNVIRIAFVSWNCHSIGNKVATSSDSSSRRRTTNKNNRKAKRRSGTQMDEMTKRRLKQKYKLIARRRSRSLTHVHTGTRPEMIPSSFNLVLPHWLAAGTHTQGMLNCWDRMGIAIEMENRFHNRRVASRLRFFLLWFRYVSLVFGFDRSINVSHFRFRAMNFYDSFSNTKTSSQS